MEPKPLYIPLILGTVRQGRRSEPAARVVYERLAAWPGVQTDWIDVAHMNLRFDGAGEDIKDPGFAAKMTRSDGLVIVTPEYNHGYPGMLKHALDTCLKEYVHKAVGVVGVSAGPWGGTRVIENLLPVLRELGLVTIFWNVHFTYAGRAFDEQGNLREPGSHDKIIGKFLRELVWMSKVLRHGRESVPIEA